MTRTSRSVQHIITAGSPVTGGSTMVSADFTHIEGRNEWRPLEINPICTAQVRASRVMQEPGFAA